MPKLFLSFTLVTYWVTARAFGKPEEPSDLLRSHGSGRKAARAEAARLLGEFEGENHVAMLVTEHANSPVPAVLIGGREDCSALWVPKEQADSRAATGLKHLPDLYWKDELDSSVNIDETGRPWASCPRVMSSETPYYGHEGAQREIQVGMLRLRDVKETVDFTSLGVDVHFNPKAYEGFQVCRDFFFSSSRTSRYSSDPTCVIAHLDESSESIRALNVADLKNLHPNLRTALTLLSLFSSTRQKKDWIRRLISSPTLRLAWHVVETFSEMRVNVLKVNVGEALNKIVLENMSLRKPLEELIRFATTCVTYEEYPQKSLQDSKRYPSPDSPNYKDYPIYEYLRFVGADVSFPKDLPTQWQPRVYDGNRSTSRAPGERDAFNFHGNWRKHVYNSWHNLWVLNLIIYDAGSMWHWSQNLSSSTFFFKPWRVTYVGTMTMAEAGPLRYDDLSPRFRVDPSLAPVQDDYAACPRHLTDLEFFEKVRSPKGRLTAEWHGQIISKSTGILERRQKACPLTEAAVPCPPKVHPDKCGTDASYIRPVESPWLYRLEREGSWVTWETEDSLNDYVDRIWSARGTSFPKLWLLNSMCESVVDRELSQSGKGRIHSGFLFLFQKAAKQVIANDINAVTRKIERTGRREVVLFTGHSLGGAVAQIAAWYYANRSRDLLQRELLQIRCVTFGAPAWGNETAYNEFLSSGVLIHDVATDMDPVTTLNGEPAFGHGLQWRKPFHYRIMLEDMDKVVVASASQMEPDFFGKLWTRKELHAESFLRRTFGALANMQNIDSVFLNPVLTHFLSYTAVLTIMADLVPEAGFGSSLAAPLLNDPPLIYAAHAVNRALIEAQTRMRWVMQRIALESGFHHNQVDGPLVNPTEEGA